MQKQLLIIRSASFQQLDNQLGSIRKSFPEHGVHILTHEHGRKLAEKYKNVTSVLTYPFQDGYKPGRYVPDLAEFDRFDAVLVLVSNGSGAGFANVFGFAIGLHSNHLYFCNLAGQIVKLSKSDVSKQRKKDIYRRIGALSLGIPLGFLCAILFATALLLSRLFGLLRQRSNTP